MVDKILSRLGLFLLLFIITIPLMWPMLSTLEGKYRPVISNVEIIKTEVKNDGINAGLDVWMKFIKNNNCEFLGISWYTSDNVRVRIITDDIPKPNEIQYDSRPVGEQHTGPWRLVGLKTLEGTKVITKHKCHPLWTTPTKFYASDVIN